MNLENTEPRERLTGRSVGHYRFGELLGRGGMGDVYRARDEHLNRDVAIKVLPAHLAGDITSRKRFVRETHVASKIVHPYVATVFDVIDETEDLYLVMELIEGQRLSHRLRESAPGQEQALLWGGEITEALAAIHRAGLVHRDLKPGNVMITGDGHVKVMDFGLARSVPTALSGMTDEVASEPTITAEGAGVGTVLYMSPEQLRGQPADQRSDLFSLGILLYESIAGVHPFRRGTIHESASAILNEPPGGGSDPDSLTDSGQLRDVLHRLLGKDPALRYQSCDELLEDLRAISQTGRVSLGWGRPSRRMLVAAVAVVALLAGTVGAGGYWLSRPPSWDRPRYSVAVAPFADRTGDDDGALRCQMIADLLTADVEASRLLRAVGPGSTVSMIGDLPPDASTSEIVDRISRGTVVDYVLVGTLYREGRRFAATVEFVAAGGGPPGLPALRSEASSVLALAESIGRQLRRQLPQVSALTAWRDDSTELDEIRSHSEKALLHYNLGMVAAGEGRLVEAIAELEKAVEIDPKFVMAQTMLAQMLHRAGYGRRAREVAATALSLAPAANSRATERLALLTRASWATVYGRTEEQVEATERLVSMFPDEPRVEQLGAEAQERAGEYEKALALIEQALELDPRSAPRNCIKGRYLMLLRRFDEAATALERAEELYSELDSTRGLAEVLYVRGQLLIYQERYDDALPVLRRSASMFTEAGDDLNGAAVNNQIADVDLMRGDTAAAKEALQATIDAARRSGNRGLECRALSSEGARLFVTGDTEAAETALTQSVDLARQIEDDRLLLNPLSNLASLLTYSGRLDDARPLLSESIDVARKLHQRGTEVKVQLLLSDVEYQLGNIESAKRSYGEVLELREEKGARRLALWADTGMAEILERQGLLSEALVHSDRAIEGSRSLSVRDVLGYALARRGQVLAALGRTQEARIAIEEARGIASSARATLGDLLSRCAIAEGMTQGLDGQWHRAVKSAEAALEGPAIPAILVPAGALRCEAQLELDRVADAVTSCREAVASQPAALAETATARCLLAEALLRAGDHVEARDEATACGADAERMGLLLPRARAATVLLSLPEELLPEDAASLRRQGRAALKTYMEAAPEADRSAVRRRPDIRRMSSVLGEPESTVNTALRRD